MAKIIKNCGTGKNCCNLFYIVKISRRGVASVFSLFPPVCCLLSTVTPASLDASILQLWRDTMNEMARISCDGYRAVVREDERFVSFFQSITPGGPLPVSYLICPAWCELLAVDCGCRICQHPHSPAHPPTHPPTYAPLACSASMFSICLAVLQ